MHGHSIYQMFNTVVILSQVLRQAGVDPAAEAFRELLLQLRRCLHYADWLKNVSDIAAYPTTSFRLGCLFTLIQ